MKKKILIELINTIMMSFNEYINENITQYLQPKSEEELKIAFKSFKKLPNDRKIETVFKNNLPYNLLPRNRNGKCIYNKFRIFNNYLWLNNYNLTSLPDNFIVNGELSVKNNQLTKLPDDLIVNGDLYCSGNKVKLELPENAVVKGNFFN